MSRTTIGPLVTRPIGVRAVARCSSARRVSRYSPSMGWYGSVAVPMAICSRAHEGLPSSRARTSGKFVFTRITEAKSSPAPISNCAW